MSFDLAVMNLEKRISSEEAAEIYDKLCDGEYDILKPSEKIDLFYQELVEKYPDINSYDDDDDEIENCPWSVELDVSDGAVVMSMVWSAADEIPSFVISLAEKHGLALYDPQDESIYLPPSLRS